MLLNKFYNLNNPTQTQIKKRLNFRPDWMIVCIIAFCCILYLNSVPNHFSMDDELVTNNNKRIEGGIKAIPGIWMTRYSEGKLKFEYRPVVKTTFALEYEFFKGNPHVSHLINLLLYILTALLLFKILKKMFAGYHPILHFFTVMLFVAHPVHTEVVASLKNRDELLSFLGCLISLYLLLKYADTSKLRYIFLAFLAYLLAYLSKSSAIVFFAILPMALYFYSNIPAKKIILITVLILATAIAARYLPRVYLPKPERDVFFFENPLFFVRNLNIVLGTGMISLLFYLKILFIPHPLVFYYGYNTIPVVSLFNPWAILSVIIHLSLFIFALYLIRRKHILSFAILYYLFSISLFSNIPAPAMGIVAERYVFAASFGFCIILSYIFMKLMKANPALKMITKKSSLKLVIVFIILLIPFSVKTITRNPNWDTQMTLYRNDIRYLEKSAKANTIIAWQMISDINKSMNQGIRPPNLQAKVDSILYFFNRSVKIFPAYYSSYNNIGLVYFTILAGIETDSLKRMNYCDTSLTYFKKALDVKPDYSDASYNLAFASEKTGRYADAIKYYRMTIRVKPGNITAMSNMANIYHDNYKNFDSAMILNKLIMKTDPSSDVPYENIGTYYMMKDDMITAVKYFEIAMDKYPGNYRLASYLESYFINKDKIKAEKYRLMAADGQNFVKIENEQE